MKRYPETVGNTFITDPYMKGSILGFKPFVDPNETEYVFEARVGNPLSNKIRELEVRIQAREKAIRGC